MEMKEERIIVLSDVDVLKSRRICREMAKDIGFDKIASGELEIAVSELATNLVKHRAVNGEIILRELENETRAGIEIIAEDKGPGIKNLRAALKGGESTAGTLGIGLSGVKRLMDEFEIDSEYGRGTKVIARKWNTKTITEKIIFSVLARPKPGEELSGDAYFIRHAKDYVIFSLIDALGHGKGAYEVAQKAIDTLGDCYREQLNNIVEKCHKNLRHTRGAAMALCRINFEKAMLEHVSIGNIETRVYNTPAPIRPFCFNGTLGVATERYKVSQYPYASGALIVMFTDGISGRFDLSSQMASKKPQEVASFIMDNYSREYDDATVLAGK